MKKSVSKKALACLLSLLVLLTSPSIGMVSAETQGDFEYRIDQKYTDTEELVSYGVITGYTGTESDITLPASVGGVPVKEVDYYAFRDCTVIKSVTIPEGITAINDWAFQGCENLEEINLSSTVTRIDSDILAGTAYYNDESNWEDGMLYLDNFLLCAKYDLPSAIIKEGTEYICRDAFWFSDINSVSIPSSVKVIGRSAFSNCKNLTEVYLPEGIELIEESAFDGCINLKTANIPASAKLEYCIFYGCEKLSSVNIAEGITCIPRLLFNECKSLREISFPKSLECIELGAFEKCGLEKVHIPANVSMIEDLAFSGCPNLKEITVDSNNKDYYTIDNVLYEKSYCDFDGDYLLTYPAAKEGDTFTFPENIVSFDNYAFAGCKNLRTININKNSFFYGINDVPNLEAINVPEEHPDYMSADGVIFDKDSKCLMMYPPAKKDASYTVPQGIEEIRDYSFENNKYIKEITFSHDVSYIPSYAVFKCENLETINISEKVMGIGDNFVHYCYNITAVNYNDTIKEWDSFLTDIESAGSPDGFYIFCTDGKIEIEPLYYGPFPDKPESDEDPTEPETDPTETTESSDPTETATVAPFEPEDPTEATVDESFTTDPAEPTYVPTSSTATEGNTGTTPPLFLAFDLGDVNMDYKLNIKDATAIQKYIANLFTFDENALELADFTQDGKINIKDTTSIQKKIAGLI